MNQPFSHRFGVVFPSSHCGEADFIFFVQKPTAADLHKYISVMTTLRGIWHGNVYDNVNVFDLGRIDLLRCCCCCDRANTETCYIANSSKICCSEHVRNTAAAHITYMK